MKERSERCNAAGFEDRRRNHKPRNVGSLQKLEQARRQIFSLQPLERNAALIIL